MTGWPFEPVIADSAGGRLTLACIIAAWIYLALVLARKVLPLNGKLVAMVQRMSKTDEIKTYGGGAKQAQKLEEQLPFRLTGLRFDEEETHDFVAVNKADTLMAMRFMNMSEERAGDLVRLSTLLIAKTLDNKDGVPVQWAVEVLPKPKNAGDDWEPKFRGPDGKLHPLTTRDKFEDFAAGSSRRRWEALLVDEQFTVELEVLVEIAKDLIERSVALPTDG